MLINPPQIRVHLQFLGFPVMNDPLYNHLVFGPEKGKGGNIGKTDEKLIADLISIHNAENWLGMDGDSDLSMFKEGDKDTDKDKDIATQLLAKDATHNGEAEGKLLMSTSLANFPLRAARPLCPPQQL